MVGTCFDWFDGLKAAPGFGVMAARCELQFKRFFDDGD
jgi:hypothetical protein